MSSHARDRIAGAVLLVVALAWLVLVYLTIEPSQGHIAGPRAFPLFFGLVLAALSLLLLLQSFRASAHAGEAADAPVGRNEAFSIVAAVVAIAAYGALMEKLGFLPTTALIVAAMTIGILRIRSPLLILSLSLGLSLGSYVVFDKLLGTHLPPGTWITLHF